MPTASAISINDGQGTPVSHQFDPQYVGSDNQVFVDKSVATTSAGRASIITSFSAANGSRKTNRISLRINLPIEQTIDSVTTVAYTLRYSGEVIVPEMATQAERDDLAAFVKNAWANTVLNALVSDLDPIY